MSDDIVTRLRAYNIGNIAHEASSHMEETLYEAADEIERLRAEVAYLKQGWYPTPAVALPYRWWGKEISGE